MLLDRSHTEEHTTANGSLLRDSGSVRETTGPFVVTRKGKRGRVANQRIKCVEDAPADGQAQPPVGNVPVGDQAAINASLLGQIKGIGGMFEELMNRIPQGAPAAVAAMQPQENDILTRCPSREFFSMIDLVEKVARIQSGLVLEAKHLKNTQARTTQVVGSQKRTWDNREAGPGQNRYPNYTRENRPEGNDNCRKCVQPGHYARECTKFLAEGNQRNRNDGNQTLPKRQAIGPRVYAVEEKGLDVEQDNV
ncbi:unnamed protein product [Arabidopsis thaliana]|uniref:(thale cress) hypothetical protein n=1 Tax=Arabidopsis thaliana TaxID=3702 RepID=A0A7G2EPR2_ARATH|nr:unnamed protein product [Arabidopsis thaliana]